MNIFGEHLYYVEKISIFNYPSIKYLPIFLPPNNYKLNTELPFVNSLRLRLHLEFELVHYILLGLEGERQN